MGTSEFETLTVTTAGVYFIVVEASTSASNYNLTIGQSISTSCNNGILRLSHGFVAGQAIVRFKDALKSDESDYDPTILASSLGMSAKAGAAGRTMLLGFRDETARGRAFAI